MGRRSRGRRRGRDPDELGVQGECGGIAVRVPDGLGLQGEPGGAAGGPETLEPPAKRGRRAGFLSAFDRREHSDRVLTLRSPSGSGSGVTVDSVHVSTAILARESDYFRAYFLGGFAETHQVAGGSDPRGIYVEDRECMLALLQAMYCGGALSTDMCKETEKLVSLLMLSDEYRVPSVVSSCVRALLRSTMTLPLAEDVLALPQHIQESDQVKELVEESRDFLEELFEDLDAAAGQPDHDFWSLSLHAVELLLSSPFVRVQTEDTVFFMVLEWARRNWPTEKWPMVASVPLRLQAGGWEHAGGISQELAGWAATRGVTLDTQRGTHIQDAGRPQSAGWGESRAAALTRLWTHVRFPQMSVDCLLAVRRYLEVEPLIEPHRIDEALRMGMMGRRAVCKLHGTLLKEYSPRPGHRPWPAFVTWKLTERDITGLSRRNIKESPERVYVKGNWYCIELRKIGLSTLFDTHQLQFRLAERDMGPPGHPYLSVKGKRAVDVGCTIWPPYGPQANSEWTHVVCFGGLTPAEHSSTNLDPKLKSSPWSHLRKFAVGSSLADQRTKCVSSNCWLEVNKLTWDPHVKRYIHPNFGHVFVEAGNVQLTLTIRPLSAWTAMSDSDDSDE